MTISKRTRVKICGITNLEDALAVASAGADAIGFVFYPDSPRCISIEKARRIVQQLPPFISCVGLFVDAEESLVRKVLEQVAIDILQFHGQEPEQACSLYNRPYIKAIRMSEDINLADEIIKYSSARALLLDTYVKDRPGGTGLSFDWSRIPADTVMPIILAGGLDVENVKQAIEQVHPYAVDVSGGVESEKGKKDPDKIVNFIRETMNA